MIACLAEKRIDLFLRGSLLHLLGCWHHHDSDHRLHSSRLTLVDLSLKTTSCTCTAKHDGWTTFDGFGHSVSLRRLLFL